MKAHYFASKNKKVVILSTGFEPVGTEVAVSGKAEARKIARQHGAEPHNF
jgi:hypothetical protein